MLRSVFYKLLTSAKTKNLSLKHLTSRTRSHVTDVKNGSAVKIAKSSLRHLASLQLFYMVMIAMAGRQNTQVSGTEILVVVSTTSRAKYIIVHIIKPCCHINSKLFLFSLGWTRR